MDEESKAVQELARTTGKAIDAASKLGGFLSKVLGSTFCEIGEAFHDWARYYRYKNLLKIQDKVDEIHQQREIEGKTIPVSPRYAIPLIQSASQEDNESLQNMWAGLIANATDPGKRIDAKKIYIQILASLEPLDAQILTYLSRQGWNLIPGPHSKGINVETLAGEFGVSQEEVKLSLQNLHRLGCIAEAFEPTWNDLGSTGFGIRIMDPKTTFRPSPLGYSLIEACKG